MSDVKNELINGRGEDAVECKREFDDAEIGADVTAVL